jgi:hypothetical protein
MTGHQLAFILQLHQLKLEMKRNIPMLRNSADVVELAFDESSYARLEWEEDHEFSFKGEMYDVIEKRAVNGKILLLCIPDKKESQLLYDYKKQTEKSQSQDKQLALKWIINYLQPVALNTTPSVRCIHLTPFPEYAASLFFRPLSIFTPPPDCC